MASHLLNSSGNPDLKQHMCVSEVSKPESGPDNLVWITYGQPHHHRTRQSELKTVFISTALGNPGSGLVQLVFRRMQMVYGQPLPDRIRQTRLKSWSCVSYYTQPWIRSGPGHLKMMWEAYGQPQRERTRSSLLFPMLRPAGLETNPILVSIISQPLKMRNAKSVLDLEHVWNNPLEKPMCSRSGIFFCVAWAGIDGALFHQWHDWFRQK